MASTAVAERPQQQVQAGEPGSPLVQLRGQLEARADEFRMVLPAHITPEKFQRTVITAVQQNPKLLTCDRRSFITACMKAAQDALLPDGREAALVPFKTRQNVGGAWQDVLLVQYMPMVYGLRKKILQSGEVKALTANVVYREEVDAGLFLYEEGTERILRHKPLLDPEFEPRDENIVAAYSIATLADGTMDFEVMRRADINKVRECSQTGALRDKKGQPREPSGPWVDWFAEQAKKSVIRRHSKTLPMSGDILDVEATDDALYARSATAALGAEAPEPPRLATPPRRIAHAEDDVVDAAGQVDDRPEPTEPGPKQARGRKKAGQADAGDGKGQTPAETATPDNPAAVEGRADEDMGEAHSGADDVRRKIADEIIDRAGKIDNMPDLNSLRSDRRADIAAMPDDIRAEVEQALENAARRLRKRPDQAS